MHSQKSFASRETGTLYLVPTPIGNLEDMTFRALRMLKEVDVIAAEDTRQTRKLLTHFEVSTPLVSYHEHNKETSGEKLLQQLKEGKNIALVSDAGMPTISDPGMELVQQALAEQLTVVPLPGANAALTALIASGLLTQPFYFYGFLGRQKKERKEQLKELQHIEATMLFYEAPHRLKETLTAMLDVFGNRQIAVCRELTKKYEEFIRGTIEEVLQWATDEEVRGEFCLVVERGEAAINEGSVWWEQLALVDHVEHYVQQGMKSKEAIKQVAEERGLSKRDVYQAYHVE